MKHSTLTSMKFIRLKRRLALPSYQVSGVLEMLWAFAATNAMDGGIGRYSDEDIAAFMEWTGDPEKLINDLVESGWIDRRNDCRLGVHDWQDHCPLWVKASMSRHKKKFLEISPKETAKEAPKQPAKATCPDMPPPNLTQPNLTQPNLTLTPNGVCPETKKSSSGPEPKAKSEVLLTFPCDGKQKSWDLELDQINEWSKLFPFVDILDQARRAMAWVTASPDRRKTARGMPRFLVRWLTNASDGRTIRVNQSARSESAARHAEATARVVAGGPASPTISKAYESKRAIEAMMNGHQGQGEFFNGK